MDCSIQKNRRLSIINIHMENTRELIYVRARLTLKSAEEGGRKTGFSSGYRPNQVFDSLNSLCPEYFTGFEKLPRKFFLTFIQDNGVNALIAKYESYKEFLSTFKHFPHFFKSDEKLTHKLRQAEDQTLRKILLRIKLDCLG